MIAVLVLLAFGLGASMLPAGSAVHPESVEIAVESIEPVTALPKDWIHCPLEGEAVSASFCSTGCFGIPPESQVPPDSVLAVGMVHILPDQRFGRAAASPEPHPPRLNILT